LQNGAEDGKDGHQGDGPSIGKVPRTDRGADAVTCVVRADVPTDVSPCDEKDCQWPHTGIYTE
ncbi:unnamed protein product, partial [marine sediment metagenome]